MLFLFYFLIKKRGFSSSENYLLTLLQIFESFEIELKYKDSKLKLRFYDIIKVIKGLKKKTQDYLVELNVLINNELKIYKKRNFKLCVKVLLDGKSVLRKDLIRW